MKKHLFLVSIIFLMSLTAIAQNGDDCIPVPWLHAEVSPDGHVSLTSEAPCDSCDIIRYQYATVNGFHPCKGEEPADGTLSLISGPQQLELPGPWVGAFAIQVVYESCLSLWTYSNVIYYDVDFHNDYTLTVEIALEDGNNPDGASVFAEGTNCYYEPRFYQEQCGTDSTAFFSEMEEGSYNLTIAKPGYQTEQVDDFYLFSDTTISVMLMAGSDPAPADFYVNPKTGLATWSLPYGKVNRNSPLSFILTLADSIVDTVSGNVFEYKFMGLHNNTDYTASVSAVYGWGESTAATYSWMTNFVGITEAENIKRIALFPNPVTERMNIVSTETILQIELINLTGQVLVEQVNDKRFTLNTTGLVQGIYMIRIITEKGIAIRKVVIK